MIRDWPPLVKTVSKKCLSMNRLCLIAYGLLVIVGMWLAVVAFMVRDMVHFVLFMGILFVLYALSAILLYRTIHAKAGLKIHKQEPKVHLTGIGAIQPGEHGITLTIPRQS